MQNKMTKEELILHGWSEEKSEEILIKQDILFSGVGYVENVEKNDDIDLGKFLSNKEIEEIPIMDFDLINNVVYLQGYPFAISLDDVSISKRFKAIIKNIDTDMYLKDEKHGSIEETYIIDEALCFYDEVDADSTLEMLNDCYPACYTLLIF